MGIHRVERTFRYTPDRKAERSTLRTTLFIQIAGKPMAESTTTKGARDAKRRNSDAAGSTGQGGLLLKGMVTTWLGLSPRATR